jgi:uncharacterized protein (DUF58 family)
MVRQEERPWQGQATILLDTRASAHVRGQHVPGTDDRLNDSFEWAVSAVASVGTALLRSGRDVSLVSDPAATDRTRYGTAMRYIDHLAAVGDSNRADLAALAPLVRTSTRDSVVVAVLGRMDGPSIEALADAHPRGWSASAFAVLLDVDTWGGEPAATPGHGCEAAATVLRSAGWRVAVARRGDTMPMLWRVLVARASSGMVLTP